MVVLDRPTAGADVELRQTLWKFISRLSREDHIAVLIIHYLEEAESLCDRIVMLKFDEMVVLDRTADLLSQFAGLQLVLSSAKSALPASPKNLRLSGSHGERGARLHLSGYSEIGQILSTCRFADCEIDNMEVAKADLEDVFMQIMWRESGLPLEPQAPAIPGFALKPIA